MRLGPANVGRPGSAYFSVVITSSRGGVTDAQGILGVGSRSGFGDGSGVTGVGAGERGDWYWRAAAGGSRRDAAAASGPGSGVGVDQGTSPLGWRAVRLDARPLGPAAPRHARVGSRSLGSRRARQLLG